uniref:Sosondowah ankyrin repeat domain family member C n=1 Tax=Takifugu rubripes TaxID=31033 RepID=A0A674P3I6_TAKRU
MASNCTEQAVQEFLMERGGRVRQMELIDHFLSVCGRNHQSTEGLDSEALKRVVDSVGFVKVEDGVKFVCLNGGGSVMRAGTDGHDHEECNGNIHETVHDSNYSHLWCRRGGKTEGEEEERVSPGDCRGSRVRDSVKGDGDSTSLLSSATDEDCASVTLDPLEHEWMLCSSDGLWDSLQPLLAVEPGLVTKRDFVTGFTCLHWAAKQGKAELLSQLLAFAKENAIPVNVNVRSSAGYTPLHLAAMHGHTQVVRVLLSDWEADPEARDYSGRRAIQYLPPPLAANLQEEGVVISPGSESDRENVNGGSGVSSGGRGWRFPKVLPGNLNPLRLLNPPAEAAEDAASGKRTKGRKELQRKSSLSRLNARFHRGRHRAQIIHSASFKDAEEVGKVEDLPSSPLRTRPLSNLFG